MIPEWFSWIDVVFVLVVLLSALGGFQKGFAGQIAQLSTFILFGILLFFAYPNIYHHMVLRFHDLDQAYVSWLILLGMAVLSLLFFILTNRALAKMFKSQISSRSDHSYGFLLGFIRGVLFALFAMILLVILGPSELANTMRAKSVAGKFVSRKLVPCVQPHLNRSTLNADFEKMRSSLFHQEDAEFPE